MPYLLSWFLPTTKILQNSTAGLEAYNLTNCHKTPAIFAGVFVLLYEI